MSRIAKTAVSVMFITIISKILGFIREIVLASAYGTTVYTDTYIVAMNIPIVICSIIGAGITTTFIPMYFNIKANSKEGEQETLRFTNNVINIVTIICIILIIIGLIFSEQIVHLFGYGFDEYELNLVNEFTKKLMPSMVFVCLSFVMTSYLQVKNNFIISSSTVILKNIIIIISIILSTKYGIDVMVWGTFIGISSEFIFQLPFCIKNGFKYQLSININDKYIRETVCLLGPIIIGAGSNQVNIMVDRMLASGLAEGSISALNYANKLNGFVTALFITSIAAVIYPTLAKLSNEKNQDYFKQTIVKSINIVILLVIPISIGAIIFSKPIVKLLFERGAFDENATIMTSSALVMYSIGMVAFGIKDIIGKIFYSLKDTKTPMINGVISMFLNIILNIVFIKYLNHAGLALGTSISSIICIILLMSSLVKKIGDFGQYRVLQTLIKSIAASTAMGVISILSYNWMMSIIKLNSISLILAILIGIVIYVIFISILKIEELDEVKYTVLSKIRK